LPDGSTEPPLTFAALDGIAFAAARGRLGDHDLPQHVAADIGPIVEMYQLARAGVLPPPLSAPWLRLDGSDSLFRAAADGVEQWFGAEGRSLGLFRCKAAGGPEMNRWKVFGVEAHKAALASGFPARIVWRLMGAMGEIRDNLIEHSEAPATGVVVFRSLPGLFEFAVSDSGVGALASLKTNSDYAYLRDEGEALQCALADGESRFGRAAGRGTGFSQLFKSLATLNASLRFRSGDHALSVEGVSPTVVEARVAIKPRAAGFMTSVRCALVR
jgi:hypothetical protein